MDLSPPPPPPPLPPPSSTPPLFRSFPVIAIALIGILATAFLLVAYYIFVIKCCLHWQRRLRNRDSTAVQNLSSSDAGDLQKNGLDEAVIRSIPVIKFRKMAEQERENDMTKKKSEKLESYECAVCLSEFEDGEKLRVIPNCCHAFHIDCIDIWLQSSANCPLCRSGISPSSILSLSNNDRILSYPLPQEQQQNSDDFSGSDEDYVVIEIQEEKKGMSMRDEWLDMRDEDGEFGDVQPIRRSISMDLSSRREFSQGISSQQCGEIGSAESDRAQDCNLSGSRVRKSIFSFGYGRSSRGSVQPLHLDP